jgi:hypothetical protein
MNRMNMKGINRLLVPCYLFIIVMAIVFPASGTITTIPEGGIVFMGEEGLDISTPMNGNTRIGWWASAASIADSAPTYIVPALPDQPFSATPSLLHSQTGVWYRLDPTGKANGTAFTVMDPTLELRIEDTTVNVDVTNKWVPTDDEIRFRIDTNLVSIAQRPGVTSVPITIKVQDPSGATYSSLINSAGTATSIVDIPVTTTPYYTAAIWDTGQRSAYVPGTYTIWAECNVNSMKDNYNYAGKTVTQKATLLNQDHNPILTGNYPATTAATATTTVATPQRTVTATTTSIPTTVEITPAGTTVMTPGPQETITVLPSATTAAPTHTPGFAWPLAAIAIGLLAFICRQRD